MNSVDSVFFFIFMIAFLSFLISLLKDLILDHDSVIKDLPQDKSSLKKKRLAVKKNNSKNAISEKPQANNDTKTTRKTGRQPSLPNSKTRRKKISTVGKKEYINNSDKIKKAR